MVSQEMLLRELREGSVLHALFEAFTSVSGLPVTVVIDTTLGWVGGWREFYSRFIPGLPPESLIGSPVHDTLTRNNDRAGECTVYYHPGGVTDASMPVFVFGRCIGHVVTGQVFVRSEDKERVRATAVSQGVTTGPFLEALDAVPVLTRERLETAVSFLARLLHTAALALGCNGKLLPGTADPALDDSPHDDPAHVDSPHDNAAHAESAHAETAAGTDGTDATAMDTDLIDADRSPLESDDLLAAISRELRTPMYGVVGMTRMLLDTPLTDEQREYLETIKASGDALVALSDTYLEYYELASGHAALEHAPLQLTACVRSCIDECRRTIRERTPAGRREPQLTLLVERDAPEVISGDEPRLRRVFTGLIDRIASTVDHGPVTVALRVIRDDAANSAGDGSAPVTIECRIRDEERGAAAAEGLPLRRLSADGVEFALATRIAALMHGSITCTSDGCVFRFRTSSIRTAPLPSDTDDLAVLAHRTIAIVSGDKVKRDLISLHLRKWGLATHATATAAEALTLVAGLPDTSILLTDAVLPDMRADALASRLAAAYPGRGIPVVVLCRDEHERYTLDTALMAGTLIEPLRKSSLRDALRGAATTAPPSSLDVGTGIASQPTSEAPVPVHFETEAPDPGIRILVADDNPLNRTLTVRVLQRLGYTTDIAVDGIDVVERAATGAWDVILMDISMPHMDGLEATRRIRANTGIALQPRIIALTAVISPSGKDVCFDAGMDDFLTKPVVIEDLQRVIRHWEELRRTDSGPVPADELDPVLVDPHAIARLRDLGQGLAEPLVSELIGLFLTDTPASLTDLEQAVASASLSNIRELAARLNGTCLNLGLRNFSSACMLLERCDTHEEAAAFLPTLRESFTRTSRTLESLRTPSA